MNTNSLNELATDIIKAFNDTKEDLRWHRQKAGSPIENGRIIGMEDVLSNFRSICQRAEKIMGDASTRKDEESAAPAIPGRAASALATPSPVNTREISVVGCGQAFDTWRKYRADMDVGGPDLQTVWDAWQAAWATREPVSLLDVHLKVRAKHSAAGKMSMHEIIAASLDAAGVSYVD